MLGPTAPLPQRCKCLPSPLTGHSFTGLPAHNSGLQRAPNPHIPPPYGPYQPCSPDPRDERRHDHFLILDFACCSAEPGLDISSLQLIDACNIRLHMILSPRRRCR